MVGTRGIWKDGWKATAVHGALPVNIGNFDKDQWELYNVDADRSESTDLASKYPEKVKEMQQVWMDEAKKYNVLPLNDLSIPEFHKLEYHKEIPTDGRFIYYPGTTEIPEASAAPTLGRSFKILAEVDFTNDTKGVIVSQGSRFGGYSLFAKDGKLTYVYNFLGLAPEQVLSTSVPANGKHIVGVEFVKEKMSDKNETLGKMRLYVDDKVVDEKPFRTQAGHYSLSGEGLCIGRDSGDPVSKQYKTKFDFNGGRIAKVVYDVSNDAYQNIEHEFKVKMSRE